MLNIGGTNIDINRTGEAYVIQKKMNQPDGILWYQLSTKTSGSDYVLIDVTLLFIPYVSHNY